MFDFSQTMMFTLKKLLQLVLLKNCNIYHDENHWRFTLLLRTHVHSVIIYILFSCYSQRYPYIYSIPGVFVLTHKGCHYIF
jgi:hypothetical protein